MEEKPQEKTDEEKQREADLETARAHRAEKAALGEKVKEPPVPRTSEFPPTPGELQFIDRLRKAKQFGRDSFYLNVLLGHAFSGKEYVSAILSLMEHQTAGERALDEFADHVRKEQAKTRAVLGDLEKSTSEGEDELRVQASNIERISRDRYVEMQERVDYLDELVRLLFAFLCDDRAWQDTSRFGRWGKNRPTTPLVPTLEQYLDGHVRSEDLPERLQKAADSLVGLAVRVATASAAGDEERQPLPPSEPIEPGTPSYDAFEQRLADGVEASKINQEAVDRSKNEIRQAVEDGLAKADEKKRSGGVSS